MQKDHAVAENIQMNIQLINFNILLGLSLTLICSTLIIGSSQIIIKIVLSFDDISSFRQRALLTSIYLIISARKKDLP